MMSIKSMEENVFTCPYPNCSFSFDNALSLSHHWGRGHKLHKKDLWLALRGLENEPTCACGCGQSVKFLDSGRGYSEYCWGHAARVSNNFQTDKSVTNSKATRKRMHQAGEIKIWSKGLTKDTDERLAKLGDKTREWLERCPEERIKKSERMKSQRQDGTTVSPSGPESGGWKGGTSPLAAVCHSNSKLFRQWKYPLLLESGFSCMQCGGNRNDKPRAELEVHHDVEYMCDIVRKISKEHNWEESLALNLPEDDVQLYEKKQAISDAVADYHINNKVSGIVLCKRCHKKEHVSHNL